MTEEKKPLPEADPAVKEKTITMFSKLEDDAEFDADTTACGISPDMLKGAMELYKQTFMPKSELEELTAKTFYNDVDLKKLGEGTTEAPATE